MGKIFSNNTKAFFQHFVGGTLCLILTGLSQSCVKEKLIVTTLGNSAVVANSVTLIGAISPVNSAQPSRKGFGYNFTGNPTITDSIIIDTKPGNEISVTLSSLSDMKRYYYSAFVEQNGEVYYGEDKSFLTGMGWLNSDLSYDSVSDIDGNSYPVITINGRQWIAENLRTTKFANGDPIPNITGDYAWMQTTGPAWCFRNNDSSLNRPFGKFYNGYTVTDSRNVCPSGWHVPSYNEWVSMLTAIDPDLLTNPTEDSSAAALKSNGVNYWLAPNADANNHSGFSAVGADFRQDSSAIPQQHFGAYWWTSDMSGLVSQWQVELSAFHSQSMLHSYGQTMGVSIRCIKNQ